jgi:hypothetical protein
LQPPPARATGGGPLVQRDRVCVTAAQEFTFWVAAGAMSTDVKPSFDELEPVVEASRRIPPPGS